MHPNNKFALAIYAVALAKYAYNTGEEGRITSEQLAENANTHPVVVRRLLAPLREAGLLTSHSGPGGGWQLSRPASEITLLDIYRSLEQEPVFAVPDAPAGVNCPLGEGFPTVLTACFREAEEAMEARLDQVTVADIVTTIPLLKHHCQKFGKEDGAVFMSGFLQERAVER